VTRRAVIITSAVVVLLVGLGLGVTRLTSSRVAVMAETGPVVPTHRVQRGSLPLTVHMNGDLRASQQQAIFAPPVGAAVRILSMLETGAVVRAGDPIVTFDPADQLYALEQAESELREADQEIIKRRADNAAQAAQDNVALLTAEFNVRRAELDAAVDADLIPANEYRIRQVSLAEATRALEQTRQDAASRATTSTAGLAVLEERRVKAQLAADRARQNIESLEVTAPIDGVVSVRENTDASGGVIFSGMTLPTYRVGDTANPGRPVMDLLDISGMEIRATVNEQERANVAAGQAVTVESDVVPHSSLTARITAVSGLGRAVRQAGPLRLFDVTLVLDSADPRLRPGTSVKVVVQGEQVDGVLLAPRQAVFEQDGKPVVYARTGGGFEPREVKVVHRTESRVAIEGVEEGTEVALISPDTAALVEAAAPASPTEPGMGP